MTSNRNYKGSVRLDWINKDLSLYYEIDEKEGRGIRPVWVPKNDIRVAEPRIFKFVKNYGDPTSENMLIKGDNLLVLRSLVEMLKGKQEKDKIKCIYIDPPFNSGNAFKYYDDNLKHSEWLTMMRDRLGLLRKILRNDGIILIHIDDEEMAYLKVLMDEIFGRENFMNCICVKMSEATGVKMTHSAKRLPKLKEYILVYKKEKIPTINIDYIKKEGWDPEYNLILESADTKRVLQLKDIMDNEGRDGGEIKIADKICSEFKVKPLEKYLDVLKIIGQEKRLNFKYTNAWRIVRTCATTQSAREAALLKAKRVKCAFFTIITKQKKMYLMKRVESSNLSKDPRIKFLFADEYLTINPGDFWSDIKTTGLESEGLVEFKKSKKPEKLIWRIINMATKKNDLIFDSFAGSGTTGAVAHKIGRRWIMVEIGKHADELIIPRMERVISGKDAFVASKDVDWKGGGGFKYYHLGESLIYEKDMNWVLKAKEMAEALFLHFQYMLVKKEWLEKENMYLGRHRFDLYHFALSFATRETKVLSEDLCEKIIDSLGKEKFKHLTIFTNVAVAIPPESLDERVLVKKIPATILREYNLL